MSIVVLGDGLLGSELVKQSGWDYISRKKDNFDLTLPDTFNSYFIQDFPEFGAQMLKYNTIINCIANTNTYLDEKQSHWDVNYKGVADLTDFCNKHNIKLIHISTDHVYANSKPNSSEEDVPVPLGTWYGHTKLLADGYIELKSKNYLIIRESHKPYPFPYKQAWYNQFTNGDYVNIIADLIIKLVNKNITGIVNVGTNIKTWFELTKDEFKTEPMEKPITAPDNVVMNLNKLDQLLSTKEVIISAYDRDYNWINQLDSNVKVTVYKKGSEPLPNEILIEPNVGRDVHTFFYHLVHNYNNLSDYTFFAQDYPFDHVENYISLINGGKQLWFDHAKQSVDGCWFFNTQYEILICDKNGSPHHPNLDIEDMWNKIFTNQCPEILKFTPAGHFCVSKKQVHKLSLDYYKRILNILETDPNSPWIIERLEPYIFCR
jgi:dTDP-4-dehydrorhamnose reductase